MRKPHIQPEDSMSTKLNDILTIKTQMSMFGYTLKITIREFYSFEVWWLRYVTKYREIR